MAANPPSSDDPSDSYGGLEGFPTASVGPVGASPLVQTPRLRISQPLFPEILLRGVLVLRGLLVLRAVLMVRGVLMVQTSIRRIFGNHSFSRTVVHVVRVVHVVQKPSDRWGCPLLGDS